MEYQCVLCAWHVEDVAESPEKCPGCGNTRFREITRTSPLDHVAPEAVAHLKKRVENCWNYERDPKIGKTYHKLELVREVDRSHAHPGIPPDVAYIVVKEVCKTCRQLYGKEQIPTSRTDVLEERGIKL